MPAPASKAVRDHFAKCAPNVPAVYAAILTAARELGHVTEEPKKSSIHLVRDSAFAGVATRKSALVLTLKSDRDRKSPRIAKREQASADRWHLEVRLENPKQVDRELRRWLEAAYALAGS